MKILAFIPARGGSKRLPGKNIRILHGKPLIAWSIDAAKDIPAICDVMVSTDDAQIADIARASGALVPWLRPAELATDHAATVDVCLHGLEWYESNHGKVDGLLLLQPTSPFRSRDTILRGIDVFGKNGSSTVVGVSAAASHPMLCYRIEENAMLPFVDGELDGKRTQDLPPAYVINGAFYLSSAENLKNLHAFYTFATVPLVMEDPRESIDIDTEWDWAIAEALSMGGR